jgi:GINS complex subunit 2
MEAEITLPESEFFAENTQITIIPNFKHQGMSLLSGFYGPFRPSVSISVPLWLGIYLKRQQKCHIIPPAWMDIEVLKAKFQEERAKEDFSEIDFYYMEISSLILTHAKDDVNNHAPVCRLIQDIHNLRTSKTRDGLQKLTPDTSSVHLRNVASIELQGIRRMLPATYDSINLIRKSESN